MSRADKRIVFVHIPRTGGTNLLNSAAIALSAKPNPVQIIDLFGESVQRFGTFRRTRETLENLHPENWGECLVHHHSTFGLWRTLGEDFKYITIIRDPIERALSHYFHSLHLYYQVDEDGSAYHLKTEVDGELMSRAYGDNALGTFVRISQHHHLLSAEAIVQFTKMHMGMARNYLTDFMARYFEFETETDPTALFPATLNLRVVEMLHKKMKEHFAGIFFDPEEAFVFLERSFEVTLDVKNKVRNSSNRYGLENGIELRYSLLPYFQYDYYLISLLRPHGARRL